MNWNIGLDIGTGGVRMAVHGRGVIYRQASAIAMRAGYEEPIAFGNEAQQLISRVPIGVAVGHPMQGGTIADEELLSQWFRYLLRHAAATNLVRRPKLLISYAPEMQITPIRHMVALAMQAGAASCSVVRSDVAAALGAPIDVMRPQATLIVDLGAGKMTASLISGGRVVDMHALPYGMQRIDETIVRRLRKSRGIAISLRTAEELKHALIGASGIQVPGVLIHAMDAECGFPKEFQIETDELKNVLDPVVHGLKELIHQLLSGAHAELLADLSDTGIVLSGGGAQLLGLDRILAEEFSLACHLPEDPSTCVIRGINQIMDADSKYEPLTTTHASVLDKRN
ncbi:rod shape-determining protein [Eubacteriales bacterium OttesenSCG-928-N13]|nr:rod shape-determining protein [Eubacteriales bacterium OttesenSCG-928-N13]